MGRAAGTIIPGTRYGHLVTTGVYIPSYIDENNKTIRATVECKCDCGSITYKILIDLKTGNTKSCGFKCPYYGLILHGLSTYKNGKAPKEYHAWNSMIHRCKNPKYKGYQYTGAKGISCHESLSTIEGFWEVIGPAPSKYHRFSRIDKDGDYEPGNVHWYLADGKKKKY